MDPLDPFSLRILAELQRDARQTIQKIADKVGLTSTPCWRRVKDMEDAGVIRSYAALVDREKLGLQVCVLADVHLTRHAEDTVSRFEQAVAACPQIIECYSTTGEADYVWKVVTPDIRAYDQFLHEVAFNLPGVSHIRSRMVLREIKYEARLPLPERTA